MTYFYSAAVPDPSSYAEDQQEAIARGAEEADWEERSVGGTGQTERQDLLDEGGRREEKHPDPWPLVGQGLPGLKRFLKPTQNYIKINIFTDNSNCDTFCYIKALQHNLDCKN